MVLLIRTTSQILITLILALFTSNVLAQSKYFTKTGHVVFEASVPSFEEVHASTRTVSALLNTENGEFAALVLIKGFRFKVALMEEHFNESYAESEKYPRATFKGTIKDFVLKNLKKEPSHLNITGTLSFHGESIEIHEIVTLQKLEKAILINLELVLNPGDFNIKIPKIVRNKVDDKVGVTIQFSLLPK